jgi:ABC-2 type transport system permease protein
LPVILIGSAFYPFAATTLRIAVYLGWAALLFDFHLHAANWLAVFAVLLATLLAFSGLGVLSAAYLLLFKRGNPAKWFILGVSSVAGGMLFPVTILPPWLQVVAHLNPVTYAMDAMRGALLDGAGILTLGHPLLLLLAFAAVLLPSSVVIFSWSLRRTKVTGTLTHR